MPLPTVPIEVDGITVNMAQRGWLERVIQRLFNVRPMRAADAIAAQALQSFRLAHEVIDGAWVLRSVVMIGGPSGVILRQPQALPPEE